MWTFHYQYEAICELPIINMKRLGFRVWWTSDWSFCEIRFQKSRFQQLESRAFRHKIFSNWPVLRSYVRSSGKIAALLLRKTSFEKPASPRTLCDFGAKKGLRRKESGDQILVAERAERFRSDYCATRVSHRPLSYDTDHVKQNSLVTTKQRFENSRL